MRALWLLPHLRRMKARFLTLGIPPAFEHFQPKAQSGFALDNAKKQGDRAVPNSVWMELLWTPSGCRE